MVNTLTSPADTPSGSPLRPRGVLAVAAPAPDGWESGGIQASTVCPDPVVRDKCITLPGGDPLSRPNQATFTPFMIEQGVECSTLSGEGRDEEARSALEQSTDYALGLTLRTGEANGAPSLEDAVELGQFANVLAAVAAIECAAAAAGKGQEYVLHATPGAAPYLADAGLIDSDGRSPSGARWIVSSGYECDSGANHHRIWATGRVWASAGAIDTDTQVNRRQNNREAWAVRSVIVGFNPCINLTAEFEPSTGGGGGSDVDPEARQQIEELREEVETLTVALNGKADATHTHSADDVVSDTLAAARIPNIPASRISSGEFAQARIPTLPQSKIADLETDLGSKLVGVTAGAGITVDNTNPTTPTIGLE